jgi:homoserine dehydrogenase
MEQEGIGDEARLSFLTHQAREGDVQDTLQALAALETVERIGGVMRIVGEGG